MQGTVNTRFSIWESNFNTLVGAYIKNFPKQIEIYVFKLAGMNVLINEVRGLKERLSDLDAAELVLQNFAGESVITLKVARADLELCARNTKIFEQTKQCVLRVVRRAYAVQTGDIKSALSINHDDLPDKVDAIVVVGGATRMPFILDEIRNSWEVDLVDERLIDPVTAVASGAALAAIPDGGMSYVVDRLPFTIELQSNNNSSKVLYTAYSPTVRHETLTSQPKLSPYNAVFRIEEDDADLRICLVDPEDESFREHDLSKLNSGTFMLSIDEFGTI
jgi:molecular chaperone DnaK (HSP70)